MIEFDDRGTVTLSLLKAKCSYSSVHSSKTLFEISSLIVTTVLSSYVVFLTEISESFFFFIHSRVARNIYGPTEPRMCTPTSAVQGDSRWDHSQPPKD
jgi:hypothetical protein